MKRKTVCPSSRLGWLVLHEFRGLLGQTEPILITGGRAGADYREAFVGIDVAKLKNAISVAESGRDGEVRYFGEVEATDASMRRVIQRITAKFDRVHFFYEAGPTGYGLHRLIRSLGHECIVVAPSLIPRKPGDRVKTNRRDSLALARLLRVGELTVVWVPDESHESYARSCSCSRCRCRDTTGSPATDKCFHAQT